VIVVAVTVVAGIVLVEILMCIHAENLAYDICILKSPVEVTHACLRASRARPAGSRNCPAFSWSLSTAAFDHRSWQS
jgi:hypothetical protein